MSFSYRDRPSLSERLRGRSGDQLFQDLEKEIEEDRKMFFDRAPGWSTTPRSGSFSRAFPFDDSPRRQDIRSHLEDLANRHPEFADHLRCPPWGGEVGARSSRWDHKQPGSEFHHDEDSHSQASNSSSTGSDGPSGTEKHGGLSHHGLRNTVDIGQQQHASEQPKESRGQRSMSAPPPDNRSQNSDQVPPRYVTRLNITPSTNVDNSRGDQGKPPVPPKQQPTQAQQPSSPKQSSSSSNVRHIPIFVEGRDEPILPKNVGESNYAPKPPHSQHSPPAHSFGKPVFNAHNQFEPPTPPKTPPQNRKFQQQARPPQTSPQQQPTPMPQAAPQPPQMPQAQQPPPKPHQPPANDPISRVTSIQKDVDELAGKVEQFSGTTRKDKEYVFLDEMLTRNLLKLDDIETEGKENVRLARKEAIKAIQKCISILEGKVPLPEEEASSEMESMDDTLCSMAAEVASEQEVSALPGPMMEVENNEPVVGQSGQVAAEKLETMDVEPVSAPDESELKTMDVEQVIAPSESELKTMAVDPVSASDESELKTMAEEPVSASGESELKTMAEEPGNASGESEQKTMEVELETEVETVAEKPSEMTAAEETTIGTMVTTQDDVGKDQCEIVLPEGVTSICDESGESGNQVTLEGDLKDLGASKETSAAEEPKAEGTFEKSQAADAKPVQETLVNVPEVKAEVESKGSESPRLKGKGTKTKKEGAKTRKGKAGKSNERKNAAEAKAGVESVASETTIESPETIVADAAVCAGRKSSDVPTA